MTRGGAAECEGAEIRRELEVHLLEWGVMWGGSRRRRGFRWRRLIGSIVRGVCDSVRERE